MVERATPASAAISGRPTFRSGARESCTRVTSMIRRRVSAALSARAFCWYVRFRVDFRNLIRQVVA
jgi:hypothetical protein